VQFGPCSNEDQQDDLSSDNSEELNADNADNAENADNADNADQVDQANLPAHQVNPLNQVEEQKVSGNPVIASS